MSSISQNTEIEQLATLSSHIILENFRYPATP